MGYLAITYNTTKTYNHFLYTYTHKIGIACPLLTSVVIPPDKILILSNKTAIPKDKSILPSRKTATRPDGGLYNHKKKEERMSISIPSKEAEFVEWSENFIAVSTANKSEWNLPENTLMEPQTLYTEVKALYEVCQTSSYTKLDMQKKNEKKDRIIHLEEVFLIRRRRGSSFETNTRRGGRREC
jgi:hypothetical protein